MSIVPDLFPPGVVLEAARPTDAASPLPVEESRHLTRAIPARMREFAQGRTAARRALQRLGVDGHPVIPVGPDRAPIWPSGVTGTISHAAGRCLVAVARTTDMRSLGLDVEPNRALEPDVAAHIVTPAEHRAYGRSDQPWDLLTFVAKEAFYKAWYPIHRQALEFHDVRVSFQTEGRFEVRGAGDAVSDHEAALFHGRWATDADWVHAAAWILPPPG